jgi:NodT family efflux transporter outer membrane factor (OMF) lipoprotein
MHPVIRSRLIKLSAIAGMVLLSSGCTSLSEYIHNGFKVGPNYCPPPAPIAEHWIDASDVRIRSQCDDISQWWCVFNDPQLNNLVACAYRQNLTLKEAAFRVLQARARLAIARGDIFPQSQTFSGSYTRQGSGTNGFSDLWNYNFNLQWELDIWGRLRRAIASADDQLQFSVADYDDVMVTLLGDIATNYVRIRTDQERIKLLNENVEIQRLVYELARKRVSVGSGGDLDVEQAESNLRQTEAQIPQLEIDIRQSADQLCTLLGIPTVDLMRYLGLAPIPTSPPEVAVGIPADLLRRRPDIRRAERAAAAQSEQIGIAQADLYPMFTLNGTLGYSANNFPDLFTSQAFNGNVGPRFNWNVLNYGRIENNVLLQDAKFQELVAVLQQTVLTADQEVEDGLIVFLRAQERTKILDESVKAGIIARGIALRLYEKGETGYDFNRYVVIEQNLITQQDSWAQARGQIAQGLIQVYRALGGGWEIKFNPPPVVPFVIPDGQPSGPGAPDMPEALPTPMPNPNEMPQRQLPPAPKP